MLGVLRTEGDDGADLHWRGLKQQRLLAALVCEANRPVSVDRLVEVVWQGQHPANATATLQVHVSHLRRALEPRRRAGGSTRVLGRPGGYELVLGMTECDLLQFIELSAQAAKSMEDGNPLNASAQLEQAVDLWRGRPLADIGDEPPFSPYVTAWEQRHLLAEEGLARARLALGNGAAALPRLMDLVRENPLREGLWELVMVALYQAGRQAEALETFARARALLTEELGVDPGPGLVRCQQRILRHDPDLSPRPPTLQFGPVPRPLTSLVGRDQLIDRLVEPLASRARRLVALTGPGGIGKSRIALEVAARCESTYDAVRYVGLADNGGGLLQSLERSAEVLADSSNAAPGGGDWSRLADALSGRSLLIVIDNAELAWEALPHVQTLLGRAGGVSVVWVSRVRPEAADVLVVPIGGLETVVTQAEDVGPPRTSPAGRLFLERMASADGNLRLDDTDAEAAEEVASRLDGVPLALELAAARCAGMSPRELADRLPRVVGPESGASKPLAAALSWSVSFLDAAQQDVLAVACAFSAPFTVADLEQLSALVGVGVDLPPALAALVRASLVDPVETPVGRRFRMLGVIRSTVRPLLLPNRAVTLELLAEAHVRHFAAISRGSSAARLLLVEPDLRDALAAARAAGDADAAADLTLGLREVLSTHNRHTEIATLCTTALAMGPSSTRRARLRVARAHTTYLLSADHMSVRADLESLSDLGDDPLGVRGLGLLAVVDAAAHDSDAADSHAGQALAMAQRLGAVELVALALSAAGHVALVTGRPRLAAEYAEQELELTGTDPVAVAWAHLNVARAHVNLADGEALAAARAALVEGRRVGSRAVILNALCALGHAEILQPDLPSAAATTLELLSALAPGDPASQRAEAITQAAACWALAGDETRCHELMSAAVQMLEDAGYQGEDPHLAVIDDLVTKAAAGLGDERTAGAAAMGRAITGFRAVVWARRGLEQLTK